VLARKPGARARQGEHHAQGPGSKQANHGHHRLGAVPRRAAEAARLLNLTLCPPRSPYDATRDVDGETQRLEIKGRCLLPGAKSGQRLGRMNLKTDWDFALMVLLDQHFDATGIWEASRRKLEQALNERGSHARNERRQLRVAKFKKIGDQIWAPGGSHTT
jgi:hypothetical protein